MGGRERGKARGERATVIYNPCMAKWQYVYLPGRTHTSATSLPCSTLIRSIARSTGTTSRAADISLVITGL